MVTMIDVPLATAGQSGLLQDTRFFAVFYKNFPGGR
jgi:hypothetical protein